MSGLDSGDAVFFGDSGEFAPTGLARGPWDPNAMHGGPVSGLIARQVEAILPAGMAPTRLTIELLRPVRLVPLRVSGRIVRPGKKVNLVEVTVETEADDGPVARALAVGIRTADIDVSSAKMPDAPLPPPLPPVVPPRPESGFPADRPSFYGGAVEIAVVDGVFWEPGPATAWFRLAKPIVHGEEPSPFVSACALADFGNGISSAIPFTEFVFINPDLTVYLHRQPVGEWICLDATTWIGDAGTGIAESALFDVSGRLGRSVQSLFVDSR